MLLQLLQRLHLFFFWITQSDFHYYPPRVLLCGTIITKSEITKQERQRRTKLSLSLSLVSKNNNINTTTTDGAFVRFRRFRKKQRHHLLLTRSVDYYE
jgi:hypothetical protein